jgi:NADH-quinone oxidoreductase subunit J
VTAELAVFYLLARGTLGSAVAMVSARNLVHAALFMVANFLLTAGLYVMLHAPFIAAVQLIVYAGAIMVLFLFVVMLLGRQDVTLDEPLGGQRLAGVSLVGLLAALLVFVVVEGVPAAPGGVAAPAKLAADFGGPAAVADVLFRDLVLPFEIVSLLLLVAMVAAVVIAQFRSEVRGIGPAGEEE